MNVRGLGNSSTTWGSCSLLDSQSSAQFFYLFTHLKRGAVFVNRQWYYYELLLLLYMAMRRILIENEHYELLVLLNVVMRRILVEN